MRKTYMKPACEVVYMEKTPLMQVSQWDTENPAGDGKQNAGGGLDTSKPGEEVLDSKGGFPWSDDFDFSMD